MIRLGEGIWIGNSLDGDYADLETQSIGGVLNLACDLDAIRITWQGAEYAKVGLIDGPGNDVAAYSAAILTLVYLTRRHEQVLIFDHDGKRALVVYMMYLNLTKGKYRPDVSGWSRWKTWDERLSDIPQYIVRILSEPNEAHKEMFDKIPYGVLEALL